MKVTRLSIENFRNIEQLNIEPCGNINVIYGQNAQGKTNLIEALWLFTGCRSFRSAKDYEMILFDRRKAEIFVEYDAFERKMNAKMTIEEKRKLSVCGVPLSTLSKGIGNFLAVVFSPSHLALIKQGPSERRRFLDIAISQLMPSYAALLAEYNRALAQRNSQLKEIFRFAQSENTLDIWEERMAHYAQRISFYRLRYIKMLRDEMEEIFYGISGGKEKIELVYDQGTRENITDKEKYIEELFNSRQRDINTGISSFGIHRDDLEIKINGLSARRFGSQGQQRSCALALKLSEAGVMKKITNEQPVVLLDDVMSELDPLRQDYILNKIKNWQVFVTCCDKNAVLNLKGGKTFMMNNGKIFEE